MVCHHIHIHMMVTYIWWWHTVYTHDGNIHMMVTYRIYIRYVTNMMVTYIWLPSYVCYHHVYIYVTIMYIYTVTNMMVTYIWWWHTYVTTSSRTFTTPRICIYIYIHIYGSADAELMIYLSSIIQGLVELLTSQTTIQGLNPNLPLHVLFEIWMCRD